MKKRPPQEKLFKIFSLGTNVIRGATQVIEQINLSAGSDKPLPFTQAYVNVYLPFSSGFRVAAQKCSSRSFILRSSHLAYALCER